MDRSLFNYIKYPVTLPSSGQILAWDISTNNVIWNSVAGTGGGTVTSAALTFGSLGFTVSGSPITSAGTFTVSGTLGLGYGGSGSTSASAARTAFGLGTLATQDGTFSGTSSGTNTGDQTIALTGDVTGSGTGSFAATIVNSAVTLAKMADMATASILGRNTAGTGAPEVLSAATTKTLLSLNSVENTALSTWPGTANITTLGTIGTGTWNGTPVALGYGGTGSTSVTNARTALGLGTIATQNSTNVSITGGSVTGITDLAVTDGGTGQSTVTAAFDALSPLTTNGDIIYRSSASNVRLAGNTSATRNFLRQVGTGSTSAAPAWDTVTKTDVGLSAVENTALTTWAGSTSLVTAGTITAGVWTGTKVAIGYGGTGSTAATAGFNALSPATTKGDIIVYDGSNNIRLAAGTDNYVLVSDSTTASGLAWVANSAGGGAATTNTFVMLSASTDCTAERVLTAGPGEIITDAGAGGNVTLNSLSINYAVKVGNYLC